jgi:hypothetical protein
MGLSLLGPNAKFAIANITPIFAALEGGRNARAGSMPDRRRRLANLAPRGVHSWGRGNLASSGCGRGAATLGGMDTPPAGKTLSRWREVAIAASIIWAFYVAIGGQMASLLLIPVGWLVIYSVVVIDRWVERGSRQN